MTLEADSFKESEVWTDWQAVKTWFGGRDALQAFLCVLAVLLLLWALCILQDWYQTSYMRRRIAGSNEKLLRGITAIERDMI